MIPQWGWIIIEILAGYFFGLLMENKFSISQRFVRFWYKYVRNKKAKLSMTVWMTSKNSFKNCSQKLIQLFRDEKNLVKVKRETQLLSEVELRDFSYTFQKHNDGIYIFEVSNQISGILDLDDDLRKIKNVIELLIEKKYIENIDDVSIQIELPFKWKYVKFLPPKNYAVDKYEVNYFNTQYKSRVNVNLKRISFTNIKLSEISQVLREFTKVI